MSSRNIETLVTIFGGTGFVGRYVVSSLARAGYRIRVITRDIVAAAPLKTQGEVGQIACVYGDARDASSIGDLLAGSHIVVNLIGLLYESGTQQFASIHTDAARIMAEEATKRGVRQLLHISALGVDRAKDSRYAQTKLAGERAVLEAFPSATILRPSIIFGEEDNFYNQFACMARFSPVLPLIGGGGTKFQPIYVVDVAHAVVHALASSTHAGKVYELGGDEIFTFKEIMQHICAITKQSPMLLPIPFGMANFMATFAQMLPKPFLTKDQVTLLHYDNVVSAGALGCAELGIQPHSARVIVPDYLTRFFAPHPSSSLAS
jgi:uncharacterized protein YbjT (DUF2867 family)